MPRFVALMNWTDEGVKNFRATVDRSEAAEAALGEAGVRFEAVYWTIGPYDLIVIVEAPDAETLTASLLNLASQGNLRSTTLRAFTADEMRAILEKAG